MPKRSAVNTAAKTVTQSSTLQSILLVVGAGIILLVFFLTSQSDTDHGHKGETLYFFDRGWGGTVGDDDDVVGGGGGGGARKKAGGGGGGGDDDFETPPDLVSSSHHNKNNNNDHHNSGNENDSHQNGQQSKQQQQNAGAKRQYRFKRDEPRRPDEVAFKHTPKSRGGQLVDPITNASLKGDLLTTAKHLYACFQKFDDDENSNKNVPVFGVPCVGRDCPHISTLIAFLNVGIGHFVVVCNSDLPEYVQFFTALQELFVGRFSVFVRPRKLSCAMSWNLIVRCFAWIGPLPAFVHIANADWHPKPTPDHENNMEFFAEWCHQNLKLVANRYHHFSSFALTQRGYLELGYFDEAIFPALTEDVEFHLKAVSKGMGELGMFPNWASGSAHVNRASQGEREIDVRNHRTARMHYIFLKWNVKIPMFRDFAKANPFKHPFNDERIHHNNSWAVDWNHIKCAETGDGRKMSAGRCYWDPHVLQELMPPGEKYKPPPRLTTLQETFPSHAYF